MRPIPLNILTLYADLDQSVAGSAGDVPATISRRLESGQRRIYAKIREGVISRQVYLGTSGDAKAERLAQAYKDAAERARLRRSTVSTIKRSGVAAPSLEVGRILDALSRAGLFEHGAVLVGTAAYQCYPCVVGCNLPNASLMTRDVDLAIARVAVPRLLAGGKALEDVLKEADPSFAAVMQGVAAPKRFRNRQGFEFDVLTTPGRKSDALKIKGLGCFATPLPFMDYLIGEAMDVTALFGRGVRLRVPNPLRYAIHKAIIAGRRIAQSQKKPKDIAQAHAIVAAYRASDPDALDDAFASARRRGPLWRAAVKELAGKE
ncbi:MAG: hypothetical protein HOP09_03755 [Hyphomicrobium sp.]|nr:hypothetical protein [Hyphomicrobium sp.]